MQKTNPLALRLMCIVDDRVPNASTALLKGTLIDAGYCIDAPERPPTGSTRYIPSSHNTQRSMAWTPSPPITYVAPHWR